MPFIGNQPAESYASFETETFSVSATTNYTLSHAVTNENEIRLVINGVVQQPGSGKAYTASGTTLTLTSATVSGDVMYAVYLGRALQTVNPPNASVGTAQLASTSVTAAKLNNDIISGTTALASEPDDTDEFLVSDAGTLKRIDYSLIKGGGITEVDRWKMSNQSYGTANVFDSGWSRYTTLSGAPHGTGMTESSGVFTFPSTGVYEILFNTYCWNNATTRGYIGVFMQGSSDGFSSNDQELSLTYGNTSTAQDHDNIAQSCIYDVTNTSNNKFRLKTTSEGTSGFYRTYLTFKKLMET